MSPVDLFAEGVAQSLPAILDRKEARQRTQQRLLAAAPANMSVVNLSLNVPGTIKNSPTLQRIFLLGWEHLQERLVCTEIILELDLPTGPEAFFLTSGSVAETKTQGVAFEEDFTFGRWFDLDVVQAGRSALSRTELGLPPRQCFICDQAAKACARNQTHALPEILAYMQNHYYQAMN